MIFLILIINDFIKNECKNEEVLLSLLNYFNETITHYHG